jgi:hypothetical protein
LHSIRNAGTYSTRPMPVALMPKPLVHLWLKSLISHIALPLVPGYSCASVDYQLASQPSLKKTYRVLPTRISAPSAQPTLKNLPTTRQPTPELHPLTWQSQHLLEISVALSLHAFLGVAVLHYLLSWLDSSASTANSKMHWISRPGESCWSDGQQLRGYIDPPRLFTVKRALVFLPSDQLKFYSTLYRAYWPPPALLVGNCTTRRELYYWSGTGSGVSQHSRVLSQESSVPSPPSHTPGT